MNPFNSRLRHNILASKLKWAGFASMGIWLAGPTSVMGATGNLLPDGPVSAGIAAFEYRISQNSVRSGMVSNGELCPVPTPKTISVDVDRPSIDFSSKVALNELWQAAAASNYSGPILGALQVDIQYVANVDQTTREIVSGAFCIDPGHVFVRVKITQTIHIPKEFTSDDCLLKLVREYQGQRARAAEEALDTVQPVFLAALNSAVHRQRPRRVSEGAAIEVFLKDIQDEIEAAIDRIQAARNRLMTNSDTPADKERRSHACGGRVPRR